MNAQKPGRVAQSVRRLTRKSEVLGSIPHTFISPSADSRGAVVSYWRKYVHEVLVDRLGGVSLPRKSVVRLTDRPDMTLDVYRGRKTTIQQQHERTKTIPTWKVNILASANGHPICLFDWSVCEVFSYSTKLFALLEK